MNIERAETGNRPKVGAEDSRRYSGVARHPLARRWILRRMVEANEAAAAAQERGDTLGEERQRLEAERVRLEARRLGISLETREGPTDGAA